MDEAIEIICAKNFHRVLWLPQNAAHDRLRVTYSTTSNFSNDSLPAILFCGPIFGSRWNSISFDHLANTTGVRIICVDRPGMGGSTPVSIDIRMNVWLETVPALLKALNVKHVSLFSHSAGTIFALNTLYQRREILDPKRPYVAFVAPWVHSAHSSATLMKLASIVPNGWLDSWNKVLSIGDTVGPSIAWSGSIFISMANLFRTDPASGDTGDTTPAERYGVSDEIGKWIDKLQWKWFLVEDTTAANEEARLCLKKGGAGTWGGFEDYEECVQLLMKQEQQRRSEDSSCSKLKVGVFFAESDMMIGKGGQQYFERCWKQDGVASAIDFMSTELPGTNHDSAILDLKKGALQSIFDFIGKGGELPQ